MNRTAMEPARCMLMESGAEPNLWTEAVNTAAYVRNRCPSRAIDNKTPLSLYLGEELTRAELEKLKPFGCRVQVLNEGGSKLDSKSIECIMLGYEEGTKGGYRVLNLSTNRVVIRKDVVFHEDTFPMKKLEYAADQGKAQSYYPNTPFDLFIGNQSDDESGAEAD